MSQVGWEALQFATRIIKIFTFSHVFSKYVGHPILTYGPSMLPTLNVRGDFVWVDGTHRRGRGIRVGDVVSVDHPLVPGEGACKRVLGMPGDWVLRDGPSSHSNMMIQVPTGHCWLAGDNQAWSRDSRDYGPQPLALIRGKVTARIWPLRQAQWLQNTLEEVQT